MPGSEPPRTPREFELFVCPECSEAYIGGGGYCPNPTHPRGLNERNEPTGVALESVRVREVLPTEPEQTATFKYAGFSGPHPSLVVPCPTCGSPVGHYCNGPDGQPVDGPCEARRELASAPSEPREPAPEEIEAVARQQREALRLVAQGLRDEANAREDFMDPFIGANEAAAELIERALDQRLVPHGDLARLSRDDLIGLAIRNLNEALRAVSSSRPSSTDEMVIRLRAALYERFHLVSCPEGENDPKWDERAHAVLRAVLGEGGE